MRCSPQKCARQSGGIATTKFECDPMVVSHASLATSKISSAYKRHGLILEKALLAALNAQGNLTAWTDYVPPSRIAGGFRRT